MNTVQHYIDAVKLLLEDGSLEQIQSIAELLSEVYTQGYHNGFVDSQEEIINNIGNHGL